MKNTNDPRLDPNLNTLAVYQNVGIYPYKINWKDIKLIVKNAKAQPSIDKNS